jgi:ABC-2 type transport system permease protein
VILRHIIAITWKDLKILVRDRGALAVLFAMPVGFVLVMTTALGGLFGGGESAISVLVVSEDKGYLSTQIVEGLKVAEGFKVETEWEGQPLTRAKAEELIISQKRQLAVILPADFSQYILGDALPSQSSELQTTTIQLMVDPALSPEFTGPIVGTLQGLLLQALMPVGIERLLDQIAPGMPQEQRLIFIEQARQGMLIGMSIEQITPPGMSLRQLPNTTQQNVPSYTLFGVFFICQVIALSLIREKQDGTFRRLLAAPLSKSALLIGKLLPYYLVNLIQIVLIFAAGIWIVPLLGNPALNLGAHPEGLIVVSLAAAAAASGLGLLVATLVKTAEATGGLSALIAVMMAGVGGCFVPAFVMPNFMQTLSKLVPHAWALQGYQDILVRGYGLSQVMPEVGVLLIFAIAFFGLALWRFRFD